MRRIVIDRPGGYEALRLLESPDPGFGQPGSSPAEGEVEVEVEAIGVNYADVIIRMGLYASARELHGYPITPGFEAAGRVAALGPGVTGIAPGDRVIVLTLVRRLRQPPAGARQSRLSLPCPPRRRAGRGRTHGVPDRMVHGPPAGPPARR